MPDIYAGGLALATRKNTKLHFAVDFPGGRAIYCDMADDTKDYSTRLDVPLDRVDKFAANTKRTRRLAIEWLVVYALNNLPASVEFRAEAEAELAKEGE